MRTIREPHVRGNALLRYAPNVKSRNYLTASPVAIPI